MKKFHAVFGLVVVIIFLLTGYWGMYTIFAGTLLYLLSSLSRKLEEPES